MRVAFPTDEHYPFQDERARSVALQIVQDFDPHVRIAGSDGMDFYSISKYSKNPARMKGTNLQNEINKWQAGQREWMDAAPNAHGYFLIGNHEDRLRRYIWNHPEISDLEVLKLQNILELFKFDIYWSEAGSKELNLYNKVVLKHGSYVRKNSAYTAKAELEKEHYSISVVAGHTHRGGTVYATTRHGLVIGQEAFCLCTLNPEYMDNPNWQQGIVLIDVDRNHLSIEPIPIHTTSNKKTAVWRGKEYTEA